jgi:archaetidylinositol phosphate synthase
LLDTHVRGYVQPLFDKAASGAISLGLTPIKITIMALLTGLVTVIFLSLGWNIAAIVFLWISGFLDAVDGTVARITHNSTDLGALLDITFDRVVELSIILALGFLGLASTMMLLLLACAIVLSMSIFLTVGNLAKRKSIKSFYYQGGLVERTEGFIFFTLIILLPTYSNHIGYLFAATIFITAIQRFIQGVNILK